MTTTGAAKAVSTCVIGREAFAEALSAVQGVIETKTSIPVLQNLLVEATSHTTIRLTGTDLDTTITRDVDARTEPAFTACIGAKKIFDIVRSLPAGADIRLELEENNWVRLSCGKSKFRLAGRARVDYPESPKMVATPIRLDAAEFKKLVALTIFTITTEASRFTLSGAKVEIAAGKLRMITTDGHRLSFVEAEVDTDQTADVLIPRKALAEILKVNAEEFNFGVTSTHIFFATAQESIVSRRLSGQFPNYEMVMPKDTAHTVTVAAADIKAAVKRVALMADERNQSMRLNIAPAEISLTATAYELGEGEEVIAAEYEGEPVAMGFNWRYLTDFLAVADTEKSVTLHFTDTNSQTDWRTEGMESYRHIIMPLRII